MQRVSSNACRRRVCGLIITPVKSLILPARRLIRSRCSSLKHDTIQRDDGCNRRGLLSVPLLALTMLQLAPFSVHAEGEGEVAEPSLADVVEPVAISEPESGSQSSDSDSNAPIKAQQVYFDIKINDEPAGRVVIELFGDAAPAGVSRFKQLAVGKQGVGYRLSKFLGIYPTYIESDGVNRLSYAAGSVSPLDGGDSLQQLEEELAGQRRSHDEAGIVSLLVREEPDERPVTEKLVAVDGELITVKSQAGQAPNGTGFTITTAASPELDATHLQIGRVVSGMELVKRISGLPINKPREDLLMKSYFQFGKAMGDKRAVTAEAGFYRPFKPVRVYACGTL